MAKPLIHLVGYGSQGRAWAECLRRSERDVTVYNRTNVGELAERVLQRPSELQIIVLACADDAIGTVYKNHVKLLDTKLLCVLLHGFSVYAGDLVPSEINSMHALALLAPKAIGPELREEFFSHFPRPHALKAAIEIPKDGDFQVPFFQLAADLGFSPENLISASFENETVGDLISEQGLLCGGVFALLEWTLERMMNAGVPPTLAREECFKELELIARMLNTKGFGATFNAISAAAKAGTVRMRDLLERFPAKAALNQASQEITNRDFADFFDQGHWKSAATELAARFEKWDSLLKEKATK